MSNCITVSIDGVNVRVFTDEKVVTEKMKEDVRKFIKNVKSKAKEEKHT